MKKLITLSIIMVAALLVFPFLPCLTGNGDSLAAATSVGDDALVFDSSEVEYPGILLEEYADNEEEGEDAEDEYYEEEENGDEEDEDEEAEDEEDSEEEAE